MVEKAVSTTDPDSGLFVKGEHERQMACEAHTACDKNGIVLATEVTAGNVHDSVAWDAVYDKVTDRFEDVMILQTHIWQDYLDALELLRKTDYGKELYARRKETIERVFAALFSCLLLLFTPEHRVSLNKTRRSLTV